MNDQQHILAGKRVYATNSGPFCGLKGTIRQARAIGDHVEDPFCFFLIALGSLREPLWFEYVGVGFLEEAFGAFLGQVRPEKPQNEP